MYCTQLTYAFLFMVMMEIFELHVNNVNKLTIKKYSQIHFLLAYKNFSKMKLIE